MMVFYKSIPLSFVFVETVEVFGDDVGGKVGVKVEVSVVDPKLEVEVEVEVNADVPVVDAVDVVGNEVGFLTAIATMTIRSNNVKAPIKIFCFLLNSQTLQ